MDRRTFIGVAAALVGASPLVAEAQSPKLPRVGFLGNATATTASSQLEAFQRGMRELGWVDGQNLTFEYRWAEGQSDRLPALVAELVQTRVDIIVLSGPLAMTASQQATRTIPVVFVV